MRSLFNVIALISSSLMILCILIQNRGQSLGVSFGGDSSYYRAKRGAERVIFNATIIFGVVFVVSILLSIISKK